MRGSLRRFLRGLSPTTALFVFTACAHTFDATQLGVPVTMASAAAQPAQGTRFSVTRRSVFLFWGAFKISEPNLQKALAQQLVGGKSVADVRIKVRSRFSDVLITGLTLGILVPRAVTFEGVIPNQ